MPEPVEDRLRQAVPIKQALLSLAGVAYVLAAFAVVELYSKLLGVLMLVPVACYALLVFMRLPSMTKARIANRIEEQSKTPVGRLVRVLQVAALLLLVVAVVSWLYERLL